MITDRLAVINQQFKQARLGIQIEQRGERLVLRGIFPPKPNSRHLYPHQQRLRLGISATPEGLQETELIAKIVVAQLWQKTFRWEHYEHLPEDTPHSSPIEDWLQQFERHFWATRGVTARSRATWEKSYAPYLSKLQFLAVEKPSLDPSQLIYETILSTDPQSRSRQVCCTAIKAFVGYVGLHLPFQIKELWGTYNHRSLQERTLPTDAEIIKHFQYIPHPGWRFVYGVMATFGLRNHEVFFTDYGELRQGNHNGIRVLAATKTGSHEVWAFPPEWIDHFGLRGGTLPPVNTDLTKTTLQRIGQQVSQQFQRYKIPFSPYDLRHAWAVRTIHYGLPDTIAAQMMGHSVTIHNRTYHRWITRRDQERAVVAALDRKDGRK